MMKNLIRKILKEQFGSKGENPLSEKEIRLFKYLNKHKTEYPTQQKLLGFIKTMMPFVGRPESDARFYYEIYTANYRPEGDYENLDKSSFKDFKSFKQRRTPNNTAYEYSSAKIPFKGSNLDGYWDVNNNNQWYYVVKSYDWYPIFLFINDQWYKVSESYSSSTAKHLSHANPARYNSGLKADVYLVTRGEINKLMDGKPFDEIKLERVNKFTTENKPTAVIGKSRWISMGWGPEKKKANFTIEKIDREGDKVKLFVTINKAGTVEGTNRLVINPDGYEVPSDFSDEIEKGIEYRVIQDNSDYLNKDNTVFSFKHVQEY
jgi:hypothetical protein